MLIAHSIILLWLQYVADGEHTLTKVARSAIWCMGEQPIPETMLQAVRQLRRPAGRARLLRPGSLAERSRVPASRVRERERGLHAQAVALVLPRVQGPVHVLTDKAAR